MKTKIDLDAPVRTIIVKVLSFDLETTSIFGRSKKEDLFFQDLLTVGCDFYELLELFASNDAINKENITCIIDNIPTSEKVSEFSDKELRKMIPHWSPSRYHTASIEDVCNEIKRHLKYDGSSGTYIYNSNLNDKSRRVYNDTYILLIANDKKYFFDINRKKTFFICDKGDI